MGHWKRDGFESGKGKVVKHWPSRREFQMVGNWEGRVGGEELYEVVILMQACVAGIRSVKMLE